MVLFEWLTNVGGHATRVQQPTENSLTRTIDSSEINSPMTGLRRVEQ